MATYLDQAALDRLSDRQLLELIWGVTLRIVVSLDGAVTLAKDEQTTPRIWSDRKLMERVYLRLLDIANEEGA